MKYISSTKLQYMYPRNPTSIGYVQPLFIFLFLRIPIVYEYALKELLLGSIDRIKKIMKSFEWD